MRVLKENCKIIYFDVDRPIAVFGNVSDGRTGIWVAKTQERIFAMDNVLRYRDLSKKELEKTMEGLL